MGCVLGKRLAGDGTRRRFHGDPFPRRSSRQTSNDIRIKKNEEEVEEEDRDKSRHNADLPSPEQVRPRPEFRLKTIQGWPSWLCTVAGDAIKDWTPRRANTFEKLDKVICTNLLIIQC